MSLVATITLLFPFADLGIGATVLSASAQLSGPSRDPNAANVVRRAYHVLFAVAGVLVLVALCVMALDGWTALVGFSSGPDDRWAITVAACVFALTIPAGLGVRILIGIDRNPLATLVLMSCPAFALGVTVVLYVIGAGGIWYAVSALGGLLIGQAVGTVLALRLCGLGWSAFARVTRPGTGSRLLAGSMWLFVVGVGLPVGLQTGRVSARALLDAGAAVPIRSDGADLRRVLVGVVYRGLGLLAGFCEEAGSHRRDCPNVVATDCDVRRDRSSDRHDGYGAARPMGGNGAVGRANRRIRLACFGIRCAAGGAGYSPAGECPADQAE